MEGNRKGVDRWPMAHSMLWGGLVIDAAILNGTSGNALINWFSEIPLISSQPLNTNPENESL